MQCSPLKEATSLREGIIKRDVILQNKYASYFNNVETLENVIEDEPHFFTEIIDNDLCALTMITKHFVRGVEKISSTGSKFMDKREECLDGCEVAGGREVKENGVNFGVIKSSSVEILGETMGGGYMMGLGGGPV
ncbi:hypothetical protein Tco_1256420 [Tanacetum coccineum]